MADAEQIQSLILQKDNKFQRACAQVLLLNNLVQELQTRYDRAVQDNHRQYRYTLRLRLCTVEGLRNMYYEYACHSADEIEALEESMRQLGVEPMPIYSWIEMHFSYKGSFQSHKSSQKSRFSYKLLYSSYAASTSFSSMTNNCIYLWYICLKQTNGGTWNDPILISFKIIYHE